MPYVAAVPIRVDGRVARAGDEIPEAEKWPAATLELTLRAGTVVFVPPQLLERDAPTGGERKGRR